MLTSLLPWAIISRFTPASASEPKNRAAIPGVPFIPSPTTATMAARGVVAMSVMTLAVPNSLRRRRVARSASGCDMTRETLAMDELCETMSTAIPAPASTANTLATTSDVPIMEAPPTVSAVSLRTTVTALTGLPPAASS